MIFWSSLISHGTSATLSGSPVRCHASLVPNITSESRDGMDGVDFHILPKKGTKKLEHRIFSAMLNIPGTQLTLVLNGKGLVLEG